MESAGIGSVKIKLFPMSLEEAVTCHLHPGEKHLYSEGIFPRRGRVTTITELNNQIDLRLIIRKTINIEYTIIRRDDMIYKVLYQESPTAAPVRERTQSVYVEAESEREVRAKLADRNYNIEYIQALDEAHLEYEKRSDDFKIESV